MIVLVIDVQRGITDDRLCHFGEFLGSVRRILQAARENHVEVIYMQHDDGPGSGFSAGDAAFGIAEAVAPADGEKRFIKTINSCFGCREFAGYLKAKREDTLMIVGLQTDFCIDATIKSAFERGYKVIVPREANATFDNDYMDGATTHRYYNEMLWPGRYADCVSTEDALALLEKCGGRHVPEETAAADERLRRQLAFALEIDKEKNVFRQTHLSGHGRRENDAEHAWHMAIMAYLLREYANEAVDIARVMLMCLIHDIVEIDAGDTYAYDAAGLATQKAREDAAKARIFSLLPADQQAELTALFDEFEAYGTPEAKFARAMDNLQPLLLNDSNNGGDWKEHSVSAEAVYGRQRKTRLGSEKLYELTDRIIQENIRKGNLSQTDAPDKRS